MDDVEIHVRSVSLDLPFEWCHAVARLANDRDVAGGHPLSGPELDAPEEFERTLQEVEDHLALYGNAYFEVRR